MTEYEEHCGGVPTAMQEVSNCVDIVIKKPLDNAVRCTPSDYESLGSAKTSVYAPRDVILYNIAEADGGKEQGSNQ